MTDVSGGSVPIKYNGVIYADGGYHSNERAGGWGFHGYVFSSDPLPEKAKGSGVPGSTPTAKGYSEKKDEQQAVNVTNYIDSFGGVPRAGSNNHTELLAAKEALTYALDKNLDNAIIYSDSEYVVKGVNQYLPNWKKANWLNRNGEERPNKAEWIAVDGLLAKLRDNNNAITLAWIKGHNGHMGNEKADSWATKGNSIGMNGSNYTYKFEQKPEGYWKATNTYNRLFDQPKWYFSSDASDRRLAKDGRVIYWTGQHGDDEDVAKPQADSSNAVLYVKEELEVFEVVRKHFIKQDTTQVGHLFVGAVRNILNASVSEDIMRFGLDVMRRNKSNWSLHTEKKIPVVHHITPTGLAFYNVGNLEYMSNILDQYIDNDKSLIVTDLTDLLYEATEKKSIVTRKFRKEITSAVKYLDVTVGYNNEISSVLRAMSEVPQMKTKIRLIVGSDIIGRNALSALTDTVKRVVAITWRESDTVIRYATIIETESDIGIWSNPFGNFKLVN